MAEEQNYEKYFKQGIEKLKLNDESHITSIIGVISGKGGVGKSLVTSLLASSLKKDGLKVGILDADITGPSIPKTFGYNLPAYQTDSLILPGVTKTGIKVISSNMLLDKEDTPIIWRSSMIVSLLGQFYKDVCWEELDVLLIDMPPGTGDISLTTFQQIPLDGIIMVTTPQDLVGMIVNKSIHMAEQMNIKMLGMVENMAYAYCPNCGEKLNLFGSLDEKTWATRFEYPRLDQIPIDPNLVSYVDRGELEYFPDTYLKNTCKLIEDIIEEKKSNE